MEPILAMKTSLTRKECSHDKALLWQLVIIPAVFPALPHPLSPAKVEELGFLSLCSRKLRPGKSHLFSVPCVTPVGAGPAARIPCA